MSRDDLRQRQEALVAALVAGAPSPPGFDPDRLSAAREALLRKRSAEVAAMWPALRQHYGLRWTDEFRAFALTRPTQGALRDGWDLARLATHNGELRGDGLRGDGLRSAAAELAGREAVWRYDGHNPPVRRRILGVRRIVTAIAARVRR